MAVMDFREGGYVFSRHKVKREFSYDQQGWDETQAQGQAEPRYGAAVDGDGLQARLGRLTHYVGAVASVGLMVGLLAWGWQLVSRDVSGVPVIRAVQGEARTTADDPGGQLTNHTGLAVNTVAGGDTASPAQQVAIAPAATELSDEDVAMGQLGATAREPMNPSETPLTFAGEPIVPMSDSEAAAKAAADAERALADQAVAEAAIIDAPASEGTVTGVVTDENGVPTQAAAITEALAQAQAEANPGVLVASSRPTRRPRVTQVAAAAPVVAPAAAVAEKPADKPAVVASSANGPVVQVGAFDSSAIAQNQWARLSGKNSSLFSGKSPVIQQHDSNGRSFWRLRVAGFGSLSEARQFCSALKTSGTDCLALGG
ncbi:SPOR domain-containing protein [Paracoccus sp. JM45]|uniref:SPOR domain-containing protein n=1 Tax=Paracoccus sp. JM45 TaxID=2283626 RepID=UPI000E6C5204|nr:SPOR domain-containing protein [Paracoccus sp. JM45]RJE79514.1 SPOR domain-containing protein [Paracoccus sp. JM45]